MSQLAYATAAKSAREILVRLQRQGYVFSPAPIAVRITAANAATIFMPPAWTEIAKPVAIEAMAATGGIRVSVAPGRLVFYEEGIGNSEAAGYWSGQESQFAGAALGASQWDYFWKDQAAAMSTPVTQVTSAYDYWKKWGFEKGMQEAARNTIDTGADLTAKLSPSTSQTLRDIGEKVDPGPPPNDEIPWGKILLGAGLLGVGVGFGVWRRRRRK